MNYKERQQAVLLNYQYTSRYRNPALSELHARSELYVKRNGRIGFLQELAESLHVVTIVVTTVAIAR
jgi:hypothetical protein